MSMTANAQAELIAARFEARGNDYPTKEEILAEVPAKSRAVKFEVGYLVAKKMALVIDYRDWNNY